VVMVPIPALVAVAVISAVILAFFVVPQLQGYRVKALGTILAVGGGLIPQLSDTLTFLQTVDWTTILTPKQAAIGALTIGLLVIWFKIFQKPTPPAPPSDPPK
jgi:hypothetical protein